jgi:uncharacterized protein YlxP (DUF503 family)
LKIGVYTVDLQFPGCGSVDEKDSVLKDFLSSVNMNSSVAASVSGRHNDPGFAEVTFVAFSKTEAAVSVLLKRVEQLIIKRNRQIVCRLQDVMIF